EVPPIPVSAYQRKRRNLRFMADEIPVPDQAPGRRPRADAERNRARLLDAARAAFTSGQASVTLEQVARDAGVGIGTLYRHFPTREALVEALYRKDLADLCATAEDLLKEQSPDRALRAWMDGFAGYVAAKREMADRSEEHTS